MGSTRRVVDHVVDELASNGVEFVFGVDGANIEDVFDALALHGGVKGVLAKHEFGAATMADGYARASSQLGVMAATSGGGSLNLVAGLGESFASGVPVLALVGQPPTALDGRGSFQDTSGSNGSLDIATLLATVSVYCHRVTAPEDILTALPAAIAAALGGGPAVLLLPKDVQQALVPTVATGPRGRAVGPGGDLAPVVDALRHRGGPVTILAGEQVVRDDARAELAQLAAALGAYVATVPDAKDVSDTGAVTGVMGHPAVADAVAASAVCLVVGTRLSVTARSGLEEVLAATPTYSIGSRPPFVAAVHVRSDDVRTALSQLTASVEQPLGQPPNPWARNGLRPPECSGRGVRYRDVMETLDRLLPDGTDVVVDAGNTGAAAIHLLPARRDGRFVVALGMGGMGYSFGAAIGVSFARTRARDTTDALRRTVVVAGDGSFYMHGMELHTAVQYRLPITFVLLNNDAHAMCVTREQLFYGGWYSYNRFSPSRLGAGLAAMFPALPAVDVDDAASLPAAIHGSLAYDGPSVVSITCSPDEIPPFAPFLAAAQQDSIREETNHVPTRA